MEEGDYRTETEILYMREREKRNTNGRARCKGSSRKEVKIEAEQTLVRSGSGSRCAQEAPSCFQATYAVSIMRHIKTRIKA